MKMRISAYLVCFFMSTCVLYGQNCQQSVYYNGLQYGYGPDHVFNQPTYSVTTITNTSAVITISYSLNQNSSDLRPFGINFNFGITYTDDFNKINVSPANSNTNSYPWGSLKHAEIIPQLTNCYEDGSMTTSTCPNFPPTNQTITINNLMPGTLYYFQPYVIGIPVNNPYGVNYTYIFSNSCFTTTGTAPTPTITPTPTVTPTNTTTPTNTVVSTGTVVNTGTTTPTTTVTANSPTVTATPFIQLKDVPAPNLFTTSPLITNNQISVSRAKVGSKKYQSYTICMNDPIVKYTPNIYLNITGTPPKGGTGSYRYLWYESIDGGNTWNSNRAFYMLPSGNMKGMCKNCPFSADSIFQKLFMRVVNSTDKNGDGIYSMSNIVSVTWIGSKSGAEHPYIEITPGNSSNPSLIAKINNATGDNYQASWSICNSFTGFGPAGSFSIAAAANTPTTTVNAFVFSAPEQTAKITTISHGAGCAALDCQIVVGNSKPDKSNNSYPVVLFGAQYWMAADLKSTQFNGGSTLTLLPASSANTSQKPGYWTSGSINSGGGLVYSSQVLTVNDNVCPDGWHIATKNDWMSLFQFVNGPDGRRAAKFLKTATWANATAVDSSTAFSAYPNGQVNSSGVVTSVGNLGTWWAATDYLTTPGVSGYVYMTGINDKAFFIANDASVSQQGHAIRCVKNIN